MKAVIPCLLLLAACGTPPAPVSVTITSPADGATVGDTFVVHLSAQNLKIVPATGTAVAGEGHHHLFVDVDPTADTMPIPKSEGIFHLGNGADSIQLVLPPGKHRIIAVEASGDHVPIKGAGRDTISIEVKGDSTHSM